MTKRERILAAIKREPTDRTPYAFWRHFPNVDKAPAGLAQTTLRFHERYGSDFLKVTPAGGYAVEDRRADCSIIPTVFSPLSLARKLSGDRLGYDLKENTRLVEDALAAITDT